MVLVFIALKCVTLLLLLSQEIFQKRKEHTGETAKLLFPSSASQVSSASCYATNLIGEQGDTEGRKGKGGG